MQESYSRQQLNAEYRDGETVVRQQDLICRECPLPSCDEQSLWCIYRFVTDPNEAQQRLTNKAVRRRQSKVRRKDYQARRYMDNRDAMLARANARHKHRRENTP